MTMDHELGNNKQKPNILYVDDEQNNLDAFVSAFRRYYNIFSATSAREGLEILRKHPIEIILTDQRMPEMTGVQFLEVVIPEYPHAIRMIVTGYIDINAIVKAINTGKVFSYITKPWDVDTLKQTLDRAALIYRLEETNRSLVKELQEKVNEQDRVMKIFKRYVPEQVIKSVEHEEESQIIQGENRIVTVLFADIRKFTTIAEQLDVNSTVNYLNDFFELVSDAVNKHNGTVNKFLGDGVLAIFGAPLSYIDNPLNAVMAAQEILLKLPEFNQKYEEKIHRTTEIGIGMSTGEVIVGNVGSSDRIEYTVIGDTVNIASRIQDLTKDKPNFILIDEKTYQDTIGKITVEPQGKKEIVGRVEPINLYRVLVNVKK